MGIYGMAWPSLVQMVAVDYRRSKNFCLLNQQKLSAPKINLRDNRLLHALISVVVALVLLA